MDELAGKTESKEANVLGFGIAASHKMASKGATSGAIHVAARVGLPWEAFTAARDPKHAFPSAQNRMHQVVHTPVDQYAGVFRRMERDDGEGNKYQAFEMVSVLPMSCDMSYRKYTEPFTLRMQLHSNVLSTVLNAGKLMVVSTEEGDKDVNKQIKPSKGTVKVLDIVPWQKVQSGLHALNANEAVTRYRCQRIHLDPFEAGDETTGLEAMKYALGHEERSSRGDRLQALYEFLDGKQKASSLANLDGGGKADLRKLERKFWEAARSSSAFPKSRHIKGGIFTTDGGKKLRTCLDED